MREFFEIMAINASALAAQRWRLNVISSNLANAETTRTPQGGPYRRKDVLFVASRESFEELLGERWRPGLLGVAVGGIIEDPRPLRVVYNPNHPDADTSGRVLLPNVNPVEEMVNMIAASRSYEANLEVFRAAKAMLLKALEIGKV